LTPKLWPYAAHYPVLICNNLRHSALEWRLWRLIWFFKALRLRIYKAKLLV
jgi:hypothetical protein